MLAGEGAICFLLIALFHSLVSRSQHFDVRSAERKLGGPNGGSTGFEFVDPVEELVYRPLIAARSFCGMLHSRRLYLRNLSVSAIHHCGDVVASSFQDVSAEVFRTLWPTFSVAARVRCELP